MAKKAAAPMRLEDRLIEDVVKRLADPVAFLAWADGFQGAERVGRIKRSKLSVLDYLLTAYVGRHIDSIYGEEARTVALVTDEEVCVSHTTRTDPPVQTTVHVALPDWLFEFFDDDEHALLLDPRDTTKLLEVIQQIHEFCFESGRLNLIDI
jgi:hypothetical protein